MSDADSAPHQHRSYAPDSVNCWVLTVSDSRSAESDTSGKLIEEKLEAAGHRALARRILSAMLPWSQSAGPERPWVAIARRT